MAIRLGSGSWVAGWWIRGQTVGTVVCGRRLFGVLRQLLTPLAGNVFDVGPLLWAASGVMVVDVVFLSVLHYVVNNIISPPQFVWEMGR